MSIVCHPASHLFLAQDVLSNSLYQYKKTLSLSFFFYTLIIFHSFSFSIRLYNWTDSLANTSSSKQLYRSHMHVFILWIWVRPLAWTASPTLSSHLRRFSFQTLGQHIDPEYQLSLSDKSLNLSSFYVKWGDWNSTYLKGVFLGPSKMIHGKH